MTKQSHVRKWNDEMYRKHSTPYSGLAGIVVRQRARVIRSLADIKPNDSVLEVGCEAGNLLARFPKAKRLVGVDISGEALSDAKSLFESIKRPADFIQCDATQPLPFSKGEFSVIICPDVLEHASEPEKVIDAVIDVSTPSTRIVLSVPNEEPVLRLKRLLAKIGLLQKVMPGIESGISEWHLHSFSKKSLLDLLSAKLRVEALRMPLGLSIVALCMPVAADIGLETP
jgi:SAM-dependent methyltransferase